MRPTRAVTRRFSNAAVLAVCHGCQPKFIIPEITQDIHCAVRFIRHYAAKWASIRLVWEEPAGARVGIFLQNARHSRRTGRTERQRPNRPRKQRRAGGVEHECVLRPVAAHIVGRNAWRGVNLYAAAKLDVRAHAGKGAWRNQPRGGTRVSLPKIIPAARGRREFRRSSTSWVRPSASEPAEPMR